MQDLKRIKRILKLIEKIWENHPYLRLGQIIGNCFAPGDCYYIKDKTLEKQLKVHYGKKGILTKHYDK